MCFIPLLWFLFTKSIYYIIQKGGGTSELEKGAVKAVQDLYDVVHHDVLSVNMRSVKLLIYASVNRIVVWFSSNHITLLTATFRGNYETWKLLSNARTEGRLFAKLKWPKDPELVCLSSFTESLHFSVYVYGWIVLLLLSENW